MRGTLIGVPTTSVLTAALAGLAFGLSLIVAVGPQNTFVLQQGIRRERVTLTVAVCTTSDIVLIAAGVGGASVLLSGRRWVVIVVGSIGIAFLAVYGAMAAWGALRPRLPDKQSRRTTTWRSTVATCLAFTWLNPGVYIDTVVLVGPVSHSHGGAQWWFGTGAMAASALWFVALGFTAGRLARVFRSARAWRVLDASVAVVMFLTAVRTALSLPGTG